MDEREFERQAADVFKRVMDLFESVDPEDADIEPSGDVLRIDCRGGARIVLNTQRTTRQIWLAGGKSGYHFSFDAEHSTWLDDKGRGELFATIASLVKDATGLQLVV